MRNRLLTFSATKNIGFTLSFNFSLDFFLTAGRVMVS